MAATNGRLKDNNSSSSNVESISGRIRNNNGPVWTKPSDEWMARKDDGGIWMGAPVKTVQLSTISVSSSSILTTEVKELLVEKESENGGNGESLKGENLLTGNGSDRNSEKVTIVDKRTGDHAVV
ncbi:hypothetical protein TYRP_001737 [Tyrophagus putrescentiae]|nr:hypothetical protein TYRP_001737 [Tyrophagus putrescentiae]